MKRPKLKTVTGCDTCRRRRKKCDETKPCCAACSRLNLICTWRMSEEPRKRASNTLTSAAPRKSDLSPGKESKHDQALISYSYDIDSGADTSPALSQAVAGDEAVGITLPSPGLIKQQMANPARISVSEQIFVEYFFRKTLPMLCTYKYTDIWETAVPYAITLDDTLRYCAADLGAWHAKTNGRFSTSPYAEGTDLVYRSVALYNRALHEFQNPRPSNPPQSTSRMLSCLLFVVLESAFGRKAEISLHIGAALKVLDDQPLISEHDSQIYLMLSRIKLQMEICILRFDDTPVERHRLLRVRDKLQGISKLQFDVHTLSLGSHEKNFFRRTSKLNDTDFSTLRTTLDNELAVVRESVLTEYQDEESKANNSIFESMLIQCELLKIFINMDPLGRQPYLTQHTDAYERILVGVNNYLLSLRRAQTEFPPPLSVDSGILAALFLTGTLCRHTKMRHRIIELLHACPRREGHWDAQQVTLALRSLIAYEQVGVAPLEDANKDEPPQEIHKHPNSPKTEALSGKDSDEDKVSPRNDFQIESSSETGIEHWSRSEIGAKLRLGRLWREDDAQPSQRSRSPSLTMEHLWNEG